MYSLNEEESERVILTAHDVRGFFQDPSVEASETVIMVGASLTLEELPLTLEDVELQVQDREGAKIGAYYIGRVDVVGSRESEEVPGRTDLALDLDGYGLPFPYAGEIWRIWAQGGPHMPGMWRSLPAKAHESWLHVVQTAWFGSGRQALLYGEEEQHEIPGADLLNISSFYCALGEAVNGLGGYMGSNPDALRDCLINSHGSRRQLLRLVWRDFDVSRQRIETEELDAAISTLRENGVDLHLA